MNAISPLQVYRWLVARELWEHRGRLIFAPLILGAIVVLGTLVGVVKAPAGAFALSNVNNISTERLPIFLSFAFAIPFLIVVAAVTGYYALDALYADRQDRSILFWKSLPISDFDTVLAKLTVATVVAPFIGLAAAFATQLVVFAIFGFGVAAHGGDFSSVWRAISLTDSMRMIVYTTLVLSLWYAPVWAWCLLASSWARRAPFLWATIPIAAIWLLETRLFGTHHVGAFLGVRFSGILPSVTIAGYNAQENPFASPLRASPRELISISDFFGNENLWIGLLIAAALVAATVWVRRYRESS